VDIRIFFQKMREVEASLPTPYVLVVSLDTSDGGKAGTKTEVTREVGAKLIVDGKARLATDEELELYREQERAARTAAEQAMMAGKVQLAVLSDQEIRALRSSLRPSKG
jgi:hypothetical protein